MESKTTYFLILIFISIYGEEDYIHKKVLEHFNEEAQAKENISDYLAILIEQLGEECKVVKILKAASSQVI